jgi:hypothetical protein
MTASPNLPDLPLINLGNAEFTATKTAFSGENTVIGEFYTSSWFEYRRCDEKHCPTTWL